MDTPIGNMTFPEPFEHITGSPAHHVVWGPGWLGYTRTEYEEGTHTQLWYYCGTTEEVSEVFQDHIYSFEDTWTGYQWIIFGIENPDVLFPFVLNPRTGFYPRAVHPRLRKFLQ